MNEKLSRRQWLACGGACLGAGLATAATASATAAAPDHAVSSQSTTSPNTKAEPFRYCLNTGTLRGYKLPLADQVAVTAKAGYQGIEPWLSDIEQYAREGGSLADLRKRTADLGLTVEDAIGFANWCVDDDAQRAKGMEQMKREMGLVAELGGLRIAAPPAGANKVSVDLRKLGERYRAVLELGRRMGVVPQLEFWGHSKTLGRPSEAALVAIEADHADACILLDVFHVYKSGGAWTGLRVLNGAALHVVHVNDYPANPPRETATDADRVFPGDGVAPLHSFLRDLDAIGFRGALSLELFNRTYWQQEPLKMAKEGLEKTRAAVRGALSKG